MDGLLARARAHLDGFERRALPADGRRPAAVAVVLLGDDSGRACFLLTRRAAGLRQHARQWALPGGRLEPGESALDTARRGLSEEVGLALGPEAALGLLDDYPTRSGFLITPVVFWGGLDPVLAPNPDEVASVHRVPLDDLDHPDVPRLVTPPVLSYYGLEENPPPLINPHDATLMKDLHHKLEAFPEVWAASMMLQKQPGSGIIIPDKLAAWLLPALQIHQQVDVGWALPGTGGVAPELQATGAWSPGGVATLSFHASVAASTPVWIVAGSMVISLPFKGGKLVPAPDVPLVLQTGADGTLALDLVLPGNLVPGQAFYLQALQPDAGAVHGMAMSNAVYATISH